MHSFPILFDDPPRLDTVSVAIVPVDRVTGLVTASGVSAKVVGLPDRPVRNLSGLLCFLNLPPTPQYDIEIDATQAGYFGPDTITFVPPAPGDPLAGKKKRQVVLLEPLPSRPLPGGATVVRGVVRRGAAEVAGAIVSAHPAGAADPSTCRSGTRGAFALAVGFPPLGVHQSEAPVTVGIELAEGADTRLLSRQLRPGRTHIFEEPVDLAGVNQPTLFIPSEG